MTSPGRPGRTAGPTSCTAGRSSRASSWPPPRADAGVPVSVVRPFSVYGPGMNDGLRRPRVPGAGTAPRRPDRDLGRRRAGPRLHPRGRRRGRGPGDHRAGRRRAGQPRHRPRHDAAGPRRDDGQGCRATRRRSRWTRACPPACRPSSLTSPGCTEFYKPRIVLEDYLAGVLGSEARRRVPRLRPPPLRRPGAGIVAGRSAASDGAHIDPPARARPAGDGRLVRRGRPACDGDVIVNDQPARQRPEHESSRRAAGLRRARSSSSPPRMTSWSRRTCWST